MISIRNCGVPLVAYLNCAVSVISIPERIGRVKGTGGSFYANVAVYRGPLNTGMTVISIETVFGYSA